MSNGLHRRVETPIVVLFAALHLVACSEYQVRTPTVETQEEDIVETVGEAGEPPDWSSCGEGWMGRYFNLPADHPDVLAQTREDADLDGGIGSSGDSADTGAGPWTLPGSPESTDWFDDQFQAFDRFDPHLEPGSGWFPVDEDLAGDPDFFAVRWRAWIRPEDRGTYDLVVGSTGPLWVEVNGELLVSRPGTEALEPEVISLELDAGQKPITVTYAHLGGESGLRFRSLSDKVDVCPPG